MAPVSELVRDVGMRTRLDGLIEGLRRAYDNAREFHDPEVGSDARTFGMQVYTFVWHEIATSGLVKVTLHEPYWFELGAEAVASHRVTGSGDIWSSFPRDRTGWPTSAVRQCSFDFAPQLSVTRNVLVLAHMGNTAEGLTSVHLCRPVVDELGFLMEWEEAELIWARGSSESAVAPPGEAAADMRPPEETKDVPTIKLKRKRKDLPDVSE